jgi:hypothetical protein
VTLAVVVGGFVGTREPEHEEGIDSALQPMAHIVDDIQLDRFVIRLVKPDISN